MTPQKVTLAEDVQKELEARIESDGGSLEDLANEAIRRGLAEGRWQRLIKTGRQAGREVLGDVTEDEAIEKIAEVVDEWRAEQRER